jgi:phosphinothricin acetyltransferase
MEVRPAEPGDLDQITEIYNEAVSSSLVTFDIIARDKETQLKWFESHKGIYPAIVATDEQRVLGFGSLSPYRDRAAYRTTVEDSIYVRSSTRRSGVGRAIMESLVASAHAGGFHAVMARMYAGNEPSIALHGSLGFQQVGIEKEVGRKFGKWLDVVVMELIVV